MLRIGITGGIGSGKSTVAKIFHVLGIPVYDADGAAKRIMQTNQALKNALQAHFGVETYLDGQLNTAYLSKRVFGNKAELDYLNDLVHPLTLQESDEWMQEQHTPYAIKEAALIFESGARAYLDYVIGVTAPKSLRILRAMKRDQADQRAVEARINRQMSDTIKMKLCDFVIMNDEQEALIPQVLKIHETLCHMSNSHVAK